MIAKGSGEADERLKIRLARHTNRQIQCHMGSLAGQRTPTGLNLSAAVIG
jgi:hypothetical protein